MASTIPFFSIIVPTYNRAHLIAKTIETILAQDFDNFEVIVIDDGSKDDTESVVRKFTDTRLVFVKKENGERGAARNFGASLAKGAYVNFVDSDDLLYSNHLTEAKKIIELNSQPEFIHLAYDHRLDNGTVMNKVQDFSEKVLTTILFDNRLSCNGVFLRHDIIRTYRFAEDRVMASSEDWELWIRLICRFRLFYSNTITSSVVNHDFRSLRTIAVDKIVARDLLMIEHLKADQEVMKVYGATFKRFIDFLCSTSRNKITEVRFSSGHGRPFAHIR
jgi:glycosyltransferase involved in cell wall biosynthesis